MNDDDLARGILRGDARAFDDLFDRYGGPLLRYLAGLAGSRIDAEDLLQETMVCVFRHIAQYEERGHFRAWVYRIATNQAWSHVRRRRPAAPAGVFDPDSLPAVSGGDPLGSLQAAEEREVAWRAIGMLPEEQRTVLLLRVSGELSFGEIARTLDIPEGTAKSRLHYAMERLRALVAREAGESPEYEARRRPCTAERSAHDPR